MSRGVVRLRPGENGSAASREEPAMKYMLIIYGNKEIFDAVPPDEWKRQLDAFDAFNDKFFETGELLGAYGVGDVTEVKRVRVRDGVPVVTDGPYLESKEHLASWYLLEVPDERRALEIAAEIPAAPLHDIEVWPVPHEGRPSV
jgi:hypothetical protein